MDIQPTVPTAESEDIKDTISHIWVHPSHMGSSSSLVQSRPTQTSQKPPRLTSPTSPRMQFIQSHPVSPRLTQTPDFTAFAQSERRRRGRRYGRLRAVEAGETRAEAVPKWLVASADWGGFAGPRGQRTRSKIVASGNIKGRY